MSFNHQPVLLNECIENLKIRPDGIYVDGTLGGAGHASEIYKRLDSSGTLIGIDQDQDALLASSEKLKCVGGKANLILANKNFRCMTEVCRENGIEKVDGILLDLGVSSYQLDNQDRGFSHNNDGPLDMRMDKLAKLTAADIVNKYSENDIKRIIYDFGEERWAARIAAFITEKRKSKIIETTLELVEVIKAAVPAGARQPGIHPAKRTFQALRIAVNNELGVLKATVEDAVSLLNAGGRLCIITFHSLEDRIVKTEFAKMSTGCRCPSDFPICICNNKPVAVQVFKKPVLPTDSEIEGNPRARSAKLRVLEKN